MTVSSGPPAPADYVDPLPGPFVDPLTTAPTAAPPVPPDAVMPVRIGKDVYTVPAVNARAVQQKFGAVPLTPEEWQAHQDMRTREAAEAAAEKLRQEQYGQLSGQLAAAASKAIETVPLVGPAAIAALPQESKAAIREAQLANPTATNVGTGAGYVGQIGAALLSGGGSAVAEGAAEGAGLGAAEAGALEAGAAQAANVAAPTILERVAGVVSAPQSAVSRVGSLVGKGVEKLVGTEGATLAGKLAQRAAVLGATGATEGAVLGGNDYLAEQAQSADPAFEGEKLFQSMGTGALFGGVTGGLLGAGEAGAHALADAVSPSMKKLAGDLTTRSFLGGRSGRAAAGIEKVGGAAELGNDMLARAGITAGESIDTIAPKIATLSKADGAALGAFRDEATARGAEGVSVKEIVGHYQKELEHLSSGWAPETPLVKEIQGRLDFLAKKLGVDSEAIAASVPPVDKEAIAAKIAQRHLEEAPTLAGVPAGEGLESATNRATEKAELARLKEVRDLQNEATQKAVDSRADAVKAAGQDLLGKKISFSDLADMRAELDQKINYARDPFTKDIPKEESFKRLRSALEDSLEKGLDKADKVFDGDALAQYKQLKMNFRRSAVANQLASKALLAKQSNSSVGLSSMLAGTAASHLAAGPLGVATGLAGAMANKALRERGMSAAAVAADKIATMSAIAKTSATVDRNLAHATDTLIDGTPPKHPYRSDHGLDTFHEKRMAVLQSEVDGGAAQRARIQAAVAGIAQHAPQTAAGFVDAASRAAAYLSTVLPRSKPANPLQPKGPKIEPSEHAKYVFGKQFDAVHDHMSVMHDASRGTIIPQQVQAWAAASPKSLDRTQKVLMKKLERDEEPMGFQKALAVSTLLGKPVTPLQEPAHLAMLQASFAPQKGGPSSGPGHEKHGATPKAARMGIASNSSLDPSRLKM